MTRCRWWLPTSPPHDLCTQLNTRMWFQSYLICARIMTHQAWCRAIGALSTWLAFCAGNRQSPTDSPLHGPVVWRFDIFFVVGLARLLNKQTDELSMIWVNMTLINYNTTGKVIAIKVRDLLSLIILWVSHSSHRVHLTNIKPGISCPVNKTGRFREDTRNDHPTAKQRWWLCACIVWASYVSLLHCFNGIYYIGHRYGNQLLIPGFTSLLQFKLMYSVDTSHSVQFYLLRYTSRALCSQQ